MGGFLFGFDTAVISGAEQAIQKLWSLSDIEHGLAIAIALYGTVIGALFGGIPADAWGRKKTLFWIGIFYLVSAVGSALAPEVYSFMFFRFLGGLGVGASSVAAPMYISEIAPARLRGQLVALFQFNIVLGILLAYVSNYFIAGIGPNDWRWMLGIEAVPALIYSLLVLLVPQSPRWLYLHQGDEAGARRVLQILDPSEADERMAALRSYMAQASQQVSLKVFFGPMFRLPIILAFLFAFFNQTAGINAIIYYAPRILKITGTATDNALLSTTLIGLFNLAFTMLGIFLIDRMGRKTLMYLGALGLIVTLGLVAQAFYVAPIDLSDIGDIDTYLAGLSSADRMKLDAAFGNVIYYLCAYIAFFALSQGAVIWVFISEIFPNEVRGYGQSLGSFTHWILAAIITNVFPFFLGRFGGGPIFLFFMCMMLLQLLYIWRLMPETKGRTLEELGLSMTGRKTKG
ncbi:MAG: sugar porter family MFS transporter [Bacteroidia bacterium]